MGTHWYNSTMPIVMVWNSTKWLWFPTVSIYFLHSIGVSTIRRLGHLEVFSQSSDLLWLWLGDLFPSLFLWSEHSLYLWSEHALHEGIIDIMQTNGGKEALYCLDSGETWMFCFILFTK